jgi:hypothetical protein
MSRAGVALIDLLRVCQVQPRHGGEFFCGGCEVGEDGGSGASADVEDLGIGLVFSFPPVYRRCNLEAERC